MLQTSRRDFVIRLASLAAVAGSGAALTACGGGDDVAPSFSYGVASGDPLADRVMLWTHAQYDGVTDDVALTWEVATDAAFATLTASGSARAVAAAAFTGKVDATGLSAGKD
jgi:alkaline phosphatase D